LLSIDSSNVVAMDGIGRVDVVLKVSLNTLTCVGPREARLFNRERNMIATWIRAAREVPQREREDARICTQTRLKGAGEYNEECVQYNIIRRLVCPTPNILYAMSGGRQSPRNLIWTDPEFSLLRASII
jgi:hypothetical protein